VFGERAARGAESIMSFVSVRVCFSRNKEEEEELRAWSNVL
jgi:hypothetical protein